jgi:hypothetical protein
MKLLVEDPLAFSLAKEQRNTEEKLENFLEMTPLRNPTLLPF